MNYYNEFDPKKAEWLRELIRQNVVAPGVVDERSIADVQPADLAGFTQCHFFAGIGIWSYALRLAGWGDDRPVWTGSCPCQPFSAAGKRKGKADERHLWPAWFRLIEASRPVAVFGEQVASRDGLAWFDDVLTDLDGAAYTVGALDTCAAGYGAPHGRQRLYFVADPEYTIRRAEREEHIYAHGRNGSGRSINARSVEHSTSNRRQQGRPESGERSTEPRCIAGGMGDSESDNGGVSVCERGSRKGGSEYRGTGCTGPVSGFWREADWVLTRSERMGDSPGLRPIAPGTFPLVNGAPCRILRLRGYGDGIVAPQAAAFIRAYMEIAE